MDNETIPNWAIYIAAAVISTVILIATAHGRDNGQWENSDPELSKWYRTLMMPDSPTISCCGEADAYWADSFEVSPSGEWIAIITDTRDDGLLGRPHMEPGTRVVVPNYKLKFDQGNPTGHGVLFVRYYNASDPTHVYCYVTPGGV